MCTCLGVSCVCVSICECVCKNVLCFVVVAFRESALSLVVEASILWREGGGFFPNMEKKSAEFRAGGGWAPFMPNITILIALMLFLVEGEG